jgi:hypothetical protein
MSGRANPILSIFATAASCSGPRARVDGSLKERGWGCDCVSGAAGVGEAIAAACDGGAPNSGGAWLGVLAIGAPGV